MNTSVYGKQGSVIKARDLPDNKILEADVVVIGSGAGGGFSAAIMAQQGLKVILLEEGPYRSKLQFNMTEKQAYLDLYQEASARKTKDKAISILQGRCVGGSTTVNWTSSFRTPEQTFKHWQEKFTVTGIDTNSMTPWFKDVEQQLSISPWTIPANENNQSLARGLNALGWEAKVIPRNVKNCANLGYCGMGCPLDAKQSMLVTTIPAALGFGATLISRARVEKFIFSKGKIASLQVQPLSSKGHISGNNYLTIIAKHYVLSAGAIGSPSILLRSKAPDPYALLGRRTFLHPTTISLALMPNAVNAFAGAPQSIYSDEFLWRDGVEGELGFKLEVPPLHPLLLSSIVPGHGRTHRNLIEQFPNMQAIIALHRDGFNALSLGGTVELNKDGSPVLDYPITDLFWRAAKESLLRMAEIQFAAGAKQVLPIHSDASLVNSWSKARSSIEQLSMEELKLSIFSAHVMGGCNMGGSDKMSVVDSFGRHHQITNLNVIDASVFPTSLGVNPQLSIYALAKRNATYLSKSL